MFECKYRSGDLCMLQSAAKGAKVVVYPEVCEKICGPTDEDKNKLLSRRKSRGKAAKDFTLADVESGWAAILAGDETRKNELEALQKEAKLSVKKPCKNCGNELPSFIKQAGSLAAAIPDILLATGERLKNRVQVKESHKFVLTRDHVLARLRKCETCSKRANGFDGWEDVLRCSLCGCYMEMKSPLKGFGCANADGHYMDRPGWDGDDYWAEIDKQYNNERSE